MCHLYKGRSKAQSAKEESAVPFSEPIQTRNESQQIEAQKMANELLEELFGSLDALILADDTSEEDKRKELYARPASVFA